MQACQLVAQDPTQHKSYNDTRSRIPDPFSPTDSQKPEKHLLLPLLNSSMLGSNSGGFLEAFYASSYVNHEENKRMFQPPKMKPAAFFCLQAHISGSNA